MNTEAIRELQSKRVAFLKAAIDFRDREQGRRLDGRLAYELLGEAVYRARFAKSPVNAAHFERRAEVLVKAIDDFRDDPAYFTEEAIDAVKLDAMVDEIFNFKASESASEATAQETTKLADPPCECAMCVARRAAGLGTPDLRAAGLGAPDLRAVLDKLMASIGAMPTDLQPSKSNGVRK